MTKLMKIGSENVRVDRIESVQDYVSTKPCSFGGGYESTFTVTMMSGEVHTESIYNKDEMKCEQEADERIEFICEEIEKL